ncbi:Glycoside hydrolase [Modestobacter italicus]|uniref:Glycoside hydrolase n=1 Tax=Modestobacter italicus (strain DSM 44449 / CECT 9708 / BC 501) TaxID=2732864 RepID=I4EXP7_MODI5|nr:family 43 glycosylhydrolase [Modestobacter marinus]CCH88160.1 Glycoside hydrolase [Modestobacter marinus]
MGSTTRWGAGPEGRRIADLGDGTYRNPVLAGDFPDPSVLKDGEDYYLTTSSFDAAPGLLIHHSRDLVNWAPLTFALPRPITTGFAVDIAAHDGRYFIYIPFIPSAWAEPDFGSEARIYVIHADSMAGPWSEPIDLGITGAIDPGHVVGEDGRRYLFLSGIRRVRLTDDGLATDGPVEHVYDGWRYPDDCVTEAYALEGPKLFHRDGWFYLVSAVGGTAGPPTGHMVTVARSRSVHGPWEDDPANPVVRTRSAEEAWWSRGHATVVEGPRGDWWLVYHGYENGYRTLGRQVLLEPVEWTEDGWLRALGGDLSEPLPKPIDLPDQPAGIPLSDPLAGPALGPQWAFHAPARDETARLQFLEGALRLAGKGTGPADASPLTVPTGDRAYEVEVTLERVGPGAQGGLLLFFNSALFLGMGWDGTTLVTYGGGKRSHYREPVAPSDSLHLRIRNDRHVVTFWHSPDGVDWTRHGMRFEASGYHANTAGDLLSLRPAVFAAGQDAVTFRVFRYRALPEVDAPAGAE